MKRTIYILYILFFSLSFCTLNTANAQTIPVADDTQVFITPQFPGPNELVSIRIENYNQDLNALEISWTLDGKFQKKGVAEKNFQFTTKGLGSVSNIKISSTAFSKEIIIRPTGMDLMWQTNGYTPPFYKGKAMYTYQSFVDFIAMPYFTTTSGTQIDPKTLVYKWSRNGTPLGNVSGYGKNIFKTNGGVLAKPLTVSVEVSTIDGSMKSQKTVSLKSNEPEIVFYENHPLYGILYNKAIPSQFDMSKKELSISSAPYFFDVKRKDDSSLSYTWSMNGKKLENQTKPDSLVLRKPDSTTGGEASISVAIQKIENTLQYANKSVKILFDSTNTE